MTQLHLQKYISKAEEDLKDALKRYEALCFELVCHNQQNECRYAVACKELKDTNILLDASILSQNRVVGMTITGGSINRELVTLYKPEV